jgi:GTPase SAR1 family protein
LDNWIKEVD